mmetsp:Transcript_21718/g.56575  ORF Transcript_21718/g.56575 Transcript_21718/m.56575 type:complete len:217 (-) Transcript_21718:49-699(-)
MLLAAAARPPSLAARPRLDSPAAGRPAALRVACRAEWAPGGVKPQRRAGALRRHAAGGEASRGPIGAVSFIQTGEKLFKDKDYAAALGQFQEAFAVEGATVQEKRAALLDIAMCHNHLGEERLGLIAIASLLETGYDDFGLLRSLADLENLQKAEKFPGLLKMFERNHDGAGNFYVAPNSEAARQAEERDTRSAFDKLRQGDWLLRVLTGKKRISK